jgi:hypothetical protein
MATHKKGKRIPVDAEKFRRVIASKGLKLEHLSINLGFAGSYLNNRLRDAEPSLLPVVADFLKSNYGISEEEYSPTENEPVCVEETHDTLDYDKLYDVIYRAMKAALQETLN